MIMIQQFVSNKFVLKDLLEMTINAGKMKLQIKMEDSLVGCVMGPRGVVVDLHNLTIFHTCRSIILGGATPGPF